MKVKPTVWGLGLLAVGLSGTYGLMQYSNHAATQAAIYKQEYAVLDGKVAEYWTELGVECPKVSQLQEMLRREEYLKARIEWAIDESTSTISIMGLVCLFTLSPGAICLYQGLKNNQKH